MLTTVAKLGSEDPGDVYLHEDGTPVLITDLDWYVRGTCEYGTCLEFLCPACGCNSGGGCGPVECPCADLTGFHDMRPAIAGVAVKPSLRRGRRVQRRKIKK